MMVGHTFRELLTLLLVFEGFCVVFIDSESVDILGIGVGKHDRALVGEPESLRKLKFT